MAAAESGCVAFLSDLAILEASVYWVICWVLHVIINNMKLSHLKTLFFYSILFKNIFLECIYESCSLLLL